VFKRSLEEVGVVEIHEFVDEGLGHSSYLVGLDDGTAAVVDPPRFPTAHEDLAARLGLELVWTLDTHSHADYVTGSPGRFDALPDDLAVYPTHGAGSFCSAPGAAERTTTLARERAENALFALGDEEEFVDRLTGGFGTFPTYFTRLPEVNRAGPTRIDTPPPLDWLHADGVAELMGQGAVVVDARPFAAFGAGHIPGALSNTLRPVFGSWLGWLVDADTPLIFVLDADQDRAEVVRQCLDIGHEHLVGELHGGIDAWADSGRQLAHIDVVAADSFEGQLIDVRQRDEYRVAHVPGADNIELGAIAATELDDGHGLTVMCGHGERAMTAASQLIARSMTVRVLDGGPDTWATATGQLLETTR
jgi:rhodanese-related sulfurtransferase